MGGVSTTYDDNRRSGDENCLRRRSARDIQTQTHTHIGSTVETCSQCISGGASHRGGPDRIVLLVMGTSAGTVWSSAHGLVSSTSLYIAVDVCVLGKCAPDDDDDAVACLGLFAEHSPRNGIVVIVENQDGSPSATQRACLACHASASAR